MSLTYILSVKSNNWNLIFCSQWEQIKIQKVQGWFALQFALSFDGNDESI